MIGKTLSHYRITAALGAGGMGEVWRATDEKLGREVALKVLPEAFAEDPDRLARFEREAKVLASLNHPNIATLYGLETADPGSGTGSDSSPKPRAPGPITFLAMELVEGEDLSERIGRGMISVDETLPIALQIAEALEAAHEAGIVHRDLKPANIKITEDGTVKVLDFGLAKAWEAEGGDISSSFSPTLTQHATLEGVILGTAAYMSPEQAKAKKVDKRSDVWAFGVVLWEMLTGRRLFEGETVTDVLAAVVRQEIDLDVLPREVPARVHRLLDRCLDRDPRPRLRDIGEARIVLDSDMSRTTDWGKPVMQAPRQRWLVAAISCLVGLVLGALLSIALQRSKPLVTDPERSARRSILMTSPLDGPRHIFGIAISPDGTTVALGQEFYGDGLLELRSLDSFESNTIPGTEGAFEPFFSPDGKWLAFFDDDELRKVSVDGGPPSVICEARVTLGGTWSDDGWIYFTHGESRLARVPADGGEPENLRQENVFAPYALPGGRGVLVSLAPADTSSRRKDTATIALVAGDGSVKKLIDGGYAPAYVASGHLVFMRQGSLFAAPFDLERLEVIGPEVRVVEEIITDSIWASAFYDVAAEGTLVYIRGPDIAATVPTWIDRDGNEEPLAMPRRVYGTFQLSPDQSKLAIQVSEAQDQIHVFDFARDTLARITFEGPSRFPTWSHDGSDLIYHAVRNGQATLMRRPVDGSSGEVSVFSGEDRRLTGAEFANPYDVSPDGRHVLVGTWGNFETGADIWLVALDGSSEPQPLLQSPDNEIIPAFSPGGDYISYLSNKAGEYGIYVRPFPDVDRREWTISARGGYDSRWSLGSNEILYRFGMHEIMSVSYTLEPEFRPGVERPVISINAHDADGYSFDLSADGERILFNQAEMSWADYPVVLVSDWFVELQELAGKGGTR